MSRGPFQLKSGVKPESTKLRGGKLYQLQLALKMWEIKQDYPRVASMREQIDREAKSAAARRQS